MHNTPISGRLAAIILSFTLAATGLAACGGSSGTSHTTSSQARTASISAALARLRAAASKPAKTAPLQATTRTAPSALGHAAGGAKTSARALPSRLFGHSVKLTARPAHPAVSAQGSVLRNALLSFSSCLHRNGVKIPAANTSGKGPAATGAKSVNTRSPQYKAALAKCRGVLASAFRQAAKRAR